MNIQDSSTQKNGVLKGNSIYGTGGFVIQGDANSVVNIYSGKITNENLPNSTKQRLFASFKEINVYGGEIIMLKDQGSNIPFSYAPVNIYGGKIVANNLSWGEKVVIEDGYLLLGGDIMVYSNSEFVMNGGELAGGNIKAGYFQYVKYKYQINGGKVNCTISSESDLSYLSLAGGLYKDKEMIESFIDSDIYEAVANTDDTTKTEYPWTIAKIHRAKSDWNYDDTYHWHSCVVNGCTELFDKSNHEWDDGEVVVPPTTTTVGEMKYTCKKCSMTKTEEIPVHTHTYSTDWEKDDTYHWHEATCNDIAECATAVSGKAEHTWDSGVVTVPATMTTPGEKLYKCTECGKTRTEEIPIHTHIFEEKWSFDSENHWHKATCDVFDDCHTAIDKNEKHVWVEGKCSTCGYVCTHNGSTKGICSVCGLDLGSGDIELVVSGDVPSAAVIDDIEEAVGMSEVESQQMAAGDYFETELTINTMVPDEEVVEKITEVLSTDESSNTCYVDITLLLKNVSTSENRPVTETKQAVTVTVRVPDEIADNSTNVGIVRVHDGVAEILNSTYDPATRLITFATDKFSVYVVYGTTVPSPDKESDYIDSLRNFLNNLIAQGASGDTVVWEAGDGLPYDVMQLIKKSDVTVEFKYTYEGVEYDVFIDKNNVPDEYQTWYGPLYLAGLKHNTHAPAGDYTVVEGDTLNAISARFGVSVDDILAKNPSITNRNLIYPGQVLDL